MRKEIVSALCVLVCLCVILSAGAAADTGKTDRAPFAYEHDPRDNPRAMRDIVYNPDAVYGFSPSKAEESTLKDYADAIDWTDEKQVADARGQRQAYHDSMEELYDIILDMVKADEDIETIARTVSRRRNELRLEAGKDDPEGLALTKKRNLEIYGNELGPTPEWLYEKYGSWEAVLLKALGANAGMDACVGLYDEYYYLYNPENGPDAGTPPQKEPAADGSGAPRAA